MRGHNEGTIYKRTKKDGTTVYRCQITVPGGRRSFTVQTEREAKRWLRQANADAANGRLAPKRPPTLNGYLTGIWLPSIKDKVKSRTVVSYRLAVSRTPVWLEEIRLDELKPLHFQRFYSELTAAGKAPRTVRQTHMVLHKAMHGTLPLDLVNRTPTEGVQTASVSSGKSSSIGPMMSLRRSGMTCV